MNKSWLEAHRNLTGISSRSSDCVSASSVGSFMKQLLWITKTHRIFLVFLSFFSEKALSFHHLNYRCLAFLQNTSQFYWLCGRLCRTRQVSSPFDLESSAVWRYSGLSLTFETSTAFSQTTVKLCPRLSSTFCICYFLEIHRSFFPQYWQIQNFIFGAHHSSCEWRCFQISPCGIRSVCFTCKSRGWDGLLSVTTRANRVTLLNLKN